MDSIRDNDDPIRQAVGQREGLRQQCKLASGVIDAFCHIVLTGNVRVTSAEELGGGDQDIGPAQKGVDDIEPLVSGQGSESWHQWYQTV